MMNFSELSDKDRKEFIGKVLGPEMPEEVLGQAGHTSLKRREDLALRRRMLRGDFEKDIAKYIQSNRFSTRGAEVARFATNVYNPLRRLASRVAVVYKKRAIRTIQKANKGDSKKFAQLNEEIRLDRRMRTLNREAWAMNTVVVIPTPYERDGEKRIRLRFFSGDNSEVIQNEDDPFGLPDVLGYRSGTDDKGNHLVTTVDAEGWHTWDRNGKMVQGKAVEHPLGRFPGAMIRMTDPPESEDEDYWDPSDGKGIRDCALEVGYIAATMGWVRKAQNRLLMVLMMEGEEGGGETQINHPEAGMKILENPSQVNLMIENFDQPITNFLAQIKANQDEVAEVHAGIPSTLADPEQRNMEDASGRLEEFNALTEIREEQIAEFSMFERALLPLIHEIAQWHGHELAISADKVKDGLQITFPPLQSLDTRKERLEIAIKGTEFGVDDQVNYLMAEHGIPTEDEGKELVMKLAERRAELDEFRASRQQPADPTAKPGQEEDPTKPGEPLSATQGRFGGRAKPNGRAAAM